MLRQLGIDDIVSLQPVIARQDALVEMLQAHGLLIFQAANCNIQIPAKVYESLRSRRPLFAMTDRAGDTAALLRSEGVKFIVPLDSKAEIAKGLLNFIAAITDGYECVRPNVHG